MHRKRILVAALLLTSVLQSTSAVLAQNTSPRHTDERTGQAVARIATRTRPLYSGRTRSRVAPVTLYPYALVAKVSGASTFPYEAVTAMLWIKDNSGLAGAGAALPKHYSRVSYRADTTVDKRVRFASCAVDCMIL
jgi:hypothetical protein